MNEDYTSNSDDRDDASNATSDAASPYSTATMDAPSNHAPDQTPVVTQVRDQVKEAVAPAVQQAQVKTGELLSQAQQQAVSRLDQQKENAVGGLGAVAETLRQTGQQLRDNDQGVITQYVSQYSETAANQVEKVSGYLRERDVNQLIGDVESFARREPTLFIAGAFLLGLAGARFLRASAPSGSSTGARSGATSSSSMALATPASPNADWNGS